MEERQQAAKHEERAQEERERPGTASNGEAVEDLDDTGKVRHG